MNITEILKTFSNSAFLFRTQTLTIGCFFLVSSNFSRQHSISFLLFLLFGHFVFYQNLNFVKKKQNKL